MCSYLFLCPSSGNHDSSGHLSIIIYHIIPHTTGVTSLKRLKIFQPFIYISVIPLDQEVYKNRVWVISFHQILEHVTYLIFFFFFFFFFFNLMKWVAYASPATGPLIHLIFKAQVHWSVSCSLRSSQYNTESISQAMNWTLRLGGAEFEAKLVHTRMQPWLS